MAMLDRAPVPLVEVVALLACMGVVAAVLGPLLIHRGIASLKIRSAAVSQALCAIVGAVVGVFAGSELYRRSSGVGAVWLWYAAGAALGGLVGSLGARRRRPWLQFRLRDLFVLTAAAAVVLALARNYNAPSIEEEHAIAAVRGAGGWVGTRLIAPSWLHPEYRAVESIHLDRTTNGNNDELQSIRELPHLSEVWIASTHVSDRGLKFLTHQTNLRRLVLPSQVTDAGLEHLEGLESLESLDLVGTQFTSAGLGHLERLKHLKHLRLRFTSVDDAGLEHLKGLTELEELDLEGTDVTDAGLEHLTAMRSLKRISLADTRVTEQGVDALKRSLPKLNASGNYRYFSVVQRVAMRALRQSRIALYRVDEEVIAAKSYSPQINDDALAHFCELRTLRKLELNDTQITDAGLEHLKGLTNLEHLDLSRTRISDAGLAHLADLTKLEKLSLVGTGITDAGLKHLEALRNLRYLWLTDTQVTDAGLEHLKGLETLEYLEVSPWRVTAAGAARLEAAMPQLDVVR